jgi:hypothetical protein
MKKIIIMMLTLSLGFGLFGCDKSKNNNDATKDFKAVDLISLMNKTYGNVADLPMVEVMEIERTNIEWLQNQTFLRDLSHVECVVSGDALIMTIPYTFVLIKVDDKANIDKMKQEVFDNANLAKWICVFADVAYVNNYGSVIMLIMGEKELADSVYQEFEKVCGSLGKKLEKFGN